jgi:hypothetical protein
MKKPSVIALCSLLSLAAVAITPSARAAEGHYEYRDGYRTQAVYPVELESHFAFGAENTYGQTGFGAGLRLSVPVIAGGIGRAPYNVAVSFGGCGADYLMVPVAAQWNIFVARRLSVFAEGGVFLYKGFFDGCGAGDGPGCSAPSDFGLLPTIAIGGRFHASDDVALTLRVGYPTSTLGVSFM